MKLKKLLPLASVAAIAGIVPAVTSCTLHFSPSEPEEQEWIYDPTNPTPPEIYTETLNVSESQGSAQDLKKYGELSNIENFLPEDLFNYTFVCVKSTNTANPFSMLAEAQKPQIGKKEVMGFNYTQKIEFPNTKKETYINLSFKNILFDFAGNQSNFNVFVPNAIKNQDAGPQDQAFPGNWSFAVKIVRDGQILADVSCDSAESFKKQAQAIFETIPKEVPALFNAPIDIYALAPSYLAKIKYS